MSNPLLSLSGVVSQRPKSIVEQFRDFRGSYIGLCLFKVMTDIFYCFKYLV
nr:MAG TPA: hypothetical protein [Bacteriophage sp.]